MENILYILVGDKPETHNFTSDRFHIDIIITPLNKVPMFLLGRRYHKVYCDASLTQKTKNQEWIDMIVKPCVNLGDKEFYLI